MRLTLLILWLVFATCERERFCVVIDAGSSGSRVHVYGLSNRHGSSLPSVRHKGTVLKNHDALSGLVSRPEAAAATLLPLVAHARLQVPEDRQRDTPIHMMATAGMRLVRPDLTEAVLEACRQVLARSGFKFDRAWAAVLPGSSEGIYSFIAANYASGALQRRLERRESRRLAPQAEPLLGVLELGGASLQVTFQAEAVPGGAHTRLVTIAGLHLTVFTHSFLGLGQDAAQHQALQLAAAELPAAAAAPQEGREDGWVAARVSDPCLPLGFQGELDSTPVSGGGYFGLCRQVAASILMGNCTSLHCGLGGMLLPPLTGQFLGIENLQYTAGFLGLPTEATIRQFVTAGQSSCATPWPELLTAFPDLEEEHLLRYCFGAAYAVALLHDGLGLGLDDRGVLYTDAVRDSTGATTVLDWTLGAMVVAAAGGGEVEGIDRQFPKAQGEAEEGMTQQSAWRAELALIGSGGFVALVFVATGDRKRRAVWKRKRRRSKAEPAKIEDDPNEESTDSESPVPLTSRVDGRQLVPRSCDVEQGQVA